MKELGTTAQEDRESAIALIEGGIEEAAQEGSKVWAKIMLDIARMFARSAGDDDLLARADTELAKLE